jgi:transcriptional regulator with XRE-family HTH domain
MAQGSHPRGTNAVMRNSDASVARRIFDLSGLSYRELARRTGLSNTHVRNVLLGRVRVTEPVAVAIAAALDLPVDVVFPLRNGGAA